MRNSGIAVVAFVLLIASSASIAAQQEPVEFADANLKAAVERALGVSDPTPGDMLGLTRLEARHRAIVNLGGLESATSLEVLYLSENQISDVSGVLQNDQFAKLARELFSC